MAVALLNKDDQGTPSNMTVSFMEVSTKICLLRLDEVDSSANPLFSLPFLSHRLDSSQTQRWSGTYSIRRTSEYTITPTLDQ